MGLKDKMKDMAGKAVDQAKQMQEDSATKKEEKAVAKAEAEANDPLLLEVESHVSGKNAWVRVYNDRIEWSKDKSVSGAKMTAAVLTLGASALVTGGVKSNKGAGSEVIYMDSVTSVATKRDGMIKEIVSVICSGNTIDFRVSKSEAQKLKDTILSAKSKSKNPTQHVTNVIHSQPTEQSVGDKVKQLAELHAQGILSDEEYSAAKAKALGL